MLIHEAVQISHELTGIELYGWDLIFPIIIKAEIFNIPQQWVASLRFWGCWLLDNWLTVSSPIVWLQPQVKLTN